MANSRYLKILTVADIFGNVTLLILGMCLLGLGMAEKSTPASVLFSAESRIGTIVGVIGLVLIFSSILNCCFAISDYAGILLALFLVSITTTILYGAHPEDSMKQDVRMRMRDMVRFKTNEPNRTDFDSIQRTFQCCGVDSYKDWFYLTVSRRIPQSCCKLLDCDTNDLSVIYHENCLNPIMESTSSLLTRIITALITLMICLPIEITIVVCMVTCFS